MKKSKEIARLQALVDKYREAVKLLYLDQWEFAEQIANILGQDEFDKCMKERD